jgi:hypothetical protein
MILAALEANHYREVMNEIKYITCRYLHRYWNTIVMWRMFNRARGSKYLHTLLGFQFVLLWKRTT